MLLVAPALILSHTSAGQEVVIRDAHETTSQTVELLEAIPNSTTPTLYAQGGGDITIVSDSALMSESGPAGTIANIDPGERSGNQISTYVVREGDTLSQIADMFGVTANTIRWANDIGANGTITPGQTLAILPIPGVQHTVQSGDTIASLAEDYNGNKDEIRDYNGITDETLAVGKTITIPYGQIEAPDPAPSTPNTPSASSPSYAGYYIRPIDGGTRTQGIHGYNAVDLASYVGAPIYAAAAGEVMIARNGGWNGGYGNYVVIKHGNGSQTLYAHMSSVTVSSGAWVTQGTHIGTLGNSGRSTGPHLHFEIRGASNPF